MKFKKITVQCTSETSDLVAYTLHEAGSMGEVFDDYNNIRQVLEEKRWDYADAKLFDETDGCFVSGFFTHETDEQSIIDRIAALSANDWADFSDLSTRVEIIDSVEWENEWKKYYVPFNIGRIAVIPEWIEHNTAGDEVPVYLNPGLAFGTGTHETTSMCIALMQKIGLEDSIVLDFGCGSGILGICAKTLGAKEVVFIDNDPQAAEATAYNCKINKIHNPKILNCDVRTADIGADVVIANITADVLCDVEPIIRSLLRPNGYAIISGIIAEKAESVKRLYSKHFSLIDSEQKNEWRAFLCKL